MLTEEQQQALANYGGLRKDSDGTWRRATEEELITTPSPLVDLHRARRKRVEATAAFLRGLDRGEAAVVNHVTSRSTSDTLVRLNTSLSNARD